MSILYLVLVIIGAVALVKWFRKSFKKHTLVWVLAIVAVLAIFIVPRFI